MARVKRIGQAPAGLPFCEGVLVDDIFYASGVLGVDLEKMRLVEGGVTAETKQAIKNIEGLLAKVGMNLKNVVKVTVYLANMEHYKAFNEVYSSFFKEEFPAREALGVNGLAFGASLEISCIAAKS